MRKTIFLLMAMIAIVSSAGIQSCQSVKSASATKMLKFNFEKGRGYDYEMIMNMDQEIMGQTTQLDISTYYSMDVTDDDGSMKTISGIFERFKMKMNIGGMNIEVDTDKPMVGNAGDSSKNPLAMVTRLFGAIKGQRFTMKVNAEGKVTDVSGFKQMAQSITDSLGLDEKDRTAMMQKFSERFNDETTKEQFERFTYIFPNKIVKVGDSWEKNTTTTGQMGGSYHSTYTVMEIEGDMVTLEEKSTIGSRTDEAKMTGDVEGTLVVDSKTGLVVTADQKMKISTNTAGTKVDMKIVTRIKGKAR